MAPRFLKLVALRNPSGLGAKIKDCLRLGALAQRVFHMWMPTCASWPHLASCPILAGSWLHHSCRAAWVWIGGWEQCGSNQDLLIIMFLSTTAIGIAKLM